MVTVRANQSDVSIFYGPKLLARHLRSWLKNDVLKNPRHEEGLRELKSHAHSDGELQAIQSIGPNAARYLKLVPTDIVVWHDEIDLAPGKLRLKQGGGHAGHNGLRSIHAHIGESYGRVRLGIGHPGHKDAVAAHVLADFAKADAGWLEDLLHGISDGAALLAAGDGAGFLNAVALRTAPPRAPRRSAGPEAAAAAGAVAAKPEPAPDPRSALQKLTDRFR